ncbi:MAG: class IV adenylate cyclase [Spirochaetales bacterium]|jgi:adenylate cyclase class 2|nr:class IV adenylate cyclase [Spirochaetales bacterium]
MPVEIEMKAWVHRPEETLGRVQRLCVFQKDYVKNDAYFSAPKASPLAGDAGSDLRVRSENGQWVCTYKKKSVKNALEVNEENEFTLSDGPLFMDLLEKLGCERSIRKVKRGKQYACRGLTVEVSDVQGLGLFVEAEKVLEAARPEEIAAWEKTIRRFFADIGIRDEDIEARPYSAMLREKGQTGKAP